MIYGSAGGFCLTVLDGACRGNFAVDGGCDEGVGLVTALFGVAGLPTVMYLRICSMRFGPMPLIARKSSTVLNAPYDFPIFKILSAADAPIPGTCCSTNAV